MVKKENAKKYKRKGSEGLLTEFLEEDISVFSHTILDGFCVTFMLVAFTLCCFWFELVGKGKSSS